MTLPRLVFQAEMKNSTGNYRAEHNTFGFVNSRLQQEYAIRDFAYPCGTGALQNKICKDLDTSDPGDHDEDVFVRARRPRTPSHRCGRR